MPCYHPLKGWPIGTTAKGKTKYKITPYAVNHVERTTSGSYESVDVDFLTSRGVAAIRDFVEIPCGQCIGCRLDRSRAWADRCLLEASQYPNNCFLTLTYDDEHLPTREYVDPNTGEICTSFPLRKRDLQLFFKRLRKKYGSGIRFFACGEYGDQTFRPHYHAIVFNHDFEDKKLFKASDLGHLYYNSDSLDTLWPFGYAITASVSWETCAYVARYVTKKLTGPLAQFYADHGLEPEFSDMSRRPGISRAWYDDHQDILSDIHISTPDGGKKIRPPKYWRRIHESIDADLVAAESQRLKDRAISQRRLILEQTSKDFQIYCETLEANKKASVLALKRGF